MTGPGPGKLELEKARIFLNEKELKGKVYIHLKGYSFARVTHLDIEAPNLGKFEGKGKFLLILGIENGIKIKLGKDWLKVLHPFLNLVLEKGQKTITWVGWKVGGIYIGFKKAEVEKLEKIAKEKFKNF